MNDDLAMQPLPAPLGDVLSAAEEYCVCGCCGMDALNLDVAVTSTWIESEGPQNARIALRQAQELLAQLKNYPSGSHHVYTGLSVEELCIVLEVIESNLEVSIPR